MDYRRNGPKITIQQILNMLSVIAEGALSIKDILVEFKKVKISVKETAVYHRIHRMEADELIQKMPKGPSATSRRGVGPHKYLLTEKGSRERDALNLANPPPSKPGPVEEAPESTPETGIRSIGDYLQMPITKPLE